MFSKISISTAAAILSACTPASAFWRMGCDVIQQGRIDPITNPGGPSPHAHKIAGAQSIGPNSDYDSLFASKCTTCSVQADKSAYWTPQLYFKHADGTYESVEAGGMTVYYLGRGTDRNNMVPFPKGFRSLSGDQAARAYDPNAKTYKGQRPISDRVSFACLAETPSKETPGMSNTNCVNGLRAQVHFPSCWNGKDLYLPDNSHTAYMSGIDNGDCPPTHPKLLPHIFFEVLYAVKKIDQSGGGNFVFSQGDSTGFGFHGDFMNGWDNNVLTEAIKQCVNTNDGGVENCAPFRASIDKDAGKNCKPLPPPILPEEKIAAPGLKLNALPGGLQQNGGTGTTVPGGAGGAGGDDKVPVGDQKKSPTEDGTVAPSGAGNQRFAAVTPAPSASPSAKSSKTSKTSTKTQNHKRDLPNTRLA